jgi:hypothetical protein
MPNILQYLWITVGVNPKIVEEKIKVDFKKKMTGVSWVKLFLT